MDDRLRDGGATYTAAVLGRILAVALVAMSTLTVVEATGGSPAGATLNSPIVGMAATPDDAGYWLVASDGGVFAYGDAHFYGSAVNLHLNEPVVGMATTHDGGGYWLVSADGGVYAYGDAQYGGSAVNLHLNRPVVGMAATPDGAGYWLVSTDGGVFGYGDARFYGSTGGIVLSKPVVGMAVTSDGGGYWLVAADGGVFAYGDAAFYGSTGGIVLSEPVVGMAASSDGGGYWLVAADGGVFAFGDARFYGSASGEVPGEPIVGTVASSDAGGYWLPTADGRVFTFGDARFFGAISKIIALYGDSLGMEAAQTFEYLAGTSGALTLLRAFGGAAICDDLGDMTTDVANLHPTVAVMEFSGDNQTPCMAAYTKGSGAYYEKYQNDAQAAINIFRSNGIPVVLIGAPPDAFTDLTVNINFLNQIYASLAASSSGVLYDDAGQSVSSNGQYTKTLPCLPVEPCTGPSGTNVVRSPDGVHFCPDGMVVQQNLFSVCDVYSSGAFRFAAAMLGPALGQ